jgi:RND family efflux transporter MFP subunit
LNIKLIKSASVVLGIALVAFGAWKFRASSQSDPTTAKAAKKARGSPMRQVTVNLVKAEKGVLNEKILITGALKPKEQVDVTFKATGRVEKIHVHIGDSVKVGDLIAELEQDELRQQVNRAKAALSVSQASLTQREAELSNAEAELARALKLQQDGLISIQDFEARKTSTEVVRAQVSLARAQREQAQAELRELNIRLSQTKVYSPISGQIAQRYVDVGALMSPTNPIVRVVNLSTLVTAANVPEREVGKLRVGNKATVHVDAFGSQAFYGRIARIAPVLDAATRSAMIEIEIPNPGGLLKAEMFARVELDLASTREAVLIPREALVYRGQQPGVYLLDNKRPMFRPIETGLTQGDKVEVLANLEAGRVVVGRGSSMISEGDRIVVAGEGEEQPLQRENRKSAAALSPNAAPQEADSKTSLKPTP